MLENAAEYAQRRSKFFKKIGEGSVAIVSGARQYVRNGDNHYPFRQHSDFYYLTGFAEPDAVAVFLPGRAEGEFILFNRAKDPTLELWNGPMAGQSGACEIYGADQSFPMDTLDVEIPKLLENRDTFYYSIGLDVAFNKRVISWLSTLRAKVKGGAALPQKLHNIDQVLSEMRLRKSDFELSCMRKAAEISVKAHQEAMKICRPGMMEYELEAEIQSVFTRMGSRAPAYEHIVGAGPNACVLHYMNNSAKIQAGDLVLIDAGAEYQYYASDVTRTFPASGRFTEAQRAIYELVLHTQLSIIELIEPGVPWNRLEEMSERLITEGLLQLGLLTGDLEDLIAKRACSRFYPHRMGHWLGLDVHDVGSYKENNKWRCLEPGMVFTVEPGIYIPANMPDVDPKWWNIGVRIEDDIHVTENGHEVLTGGLAKTVEDLET